MNVVELYLEKQNRIWQAKTRIFNFTILPMKVKDRILGYYIQYEKANAATSKLSMKFMEFNYEYADREKGIDSETLISLFEMYGVDVKRSKVGSYNFLVFPTISDANDLLIAMKNITLTKGWIDFKAMYEDNMQFNADID
jgi:hypothetical protein